MKKWHLLFVWALIVHVIMRFMDTDIIAEYNMLIILYGIPLVVSIIYIFWIYPLLILFRWKEIK